MYIYWSIQVVRLHQGSAFDGTVRLLVLCELSLIMVVSKKFRCGEGGHGLSHEVVVGYEILP